MWVNRRTAITIRVQQRGGRGGGGGVCVGVVSEGFPKMLCNKKGTSQSLATVFVPKTKFWFLLVIKKSAKM